MDPVELELARNRLEGIAEEVGDVLVSTAYSPNIKERRDCSAAVFDSNARCVAQAAHIPVHLGAMPASVEHAARLGPGEGDVIAVNDPFAGGTHLPDLTLVSPVFADGHVGYVATRAHHADVGGTVPGSMPADSTTVHDEGTRVPPVRLVEDGEVNGALLETFLANVRGADERRADLRAQISANERGVRRLAEYVEENGTDAFDALIGYAERRGRDEIGSLTDGVGEAVEPMDGGDAPRIRVRVEVEGDRLVVDFSGTSEQHDGNLNAPRAVAESAVAFVVRCVTGDDVPANAGSLAPVDVVVPEGSVLNPEPPAAVAGGNVETSQRVVDAVVEALRDATDAELPAQGQGTMNSVTVGNDGFSYYETVGGGGGGTAERDGTDGVHVGMTNTLNTPIEALEREYPLRVEEYRLRKESGGSGAQEGGDGIVRSFVVLEDASVSFLTDRRENPPRGAEGGGDGATGVNLIDGEPVGPRTVVEVEGGTRIEVRTPGGGGYGEDEKET
jgi:N-methylhydantoinase B